ncbi:hypothetical protein GQ53DRAFT_847841 [Thozetella sp. PMI_491]|nr:hypothetical protein GQ53DRAFT_847841 [Thozetella sp. PMI_491]
MVRLATLVFAFTGAFPSLILAKGCTTGLIYCGYNLVSIGRYEGEIMAELTRVGLPIDSEHRYQSVFRCGEGGEGWIEFANYCDKGCYNGGTGHSDRCL